MLAQDSQQGSDSEELNRLAHHIQLMGVSYSRLEQCMVDLVKAIHLLVEQNSAILQALAEDDAEDEEPEIGYLSVKPRKR